MSHPLHRFGDRKMHRKWWPIPTWWLAFRVTTCVRMHFNDYPSDSHNWPYTSFIPPPPVQRCGPAPRSPPRIQRIRPPPHRLHRPGRRHAATVRPPRRRADVSPPLHSVGRPTFANAVACSIWTRRSTSCAERCPPSPTRSVCRASKRYVWPSPTSDSCRRFWPPDRRPAVTICITFTIITAPGRPRHRRRPLWIAAVIRHGVAVIFLRRCRRIMQRRQLERPLLWALCRTTPTIMVCRRLGIFIILLSYYAIIYVVLL